VGDRDVDRRIILRWILRKYGVRVWTGFMWIRVGSSGGNSNEPSVSMKGREFVV
jgi:hypothetical protein